MRPGLELNIEGIEVDMAVEEEAGAVRAHMMEVEAMVALIKADMAAAEADAAGEDKMVDKEGHDLLRNVIRQDIRDSFDDTIVPVQYDDIMGRRLNRVPD
jgi:hypothetical protein